MLDRAFQAKFFQQITTLTGVELDEKIAKVEDLATQFVRGSEASSDSKFMLRHLRRARTELLFNQQDSVKH